jgi:hypothetical protein
MRKRLKFAASAVYIFFDIKTKEIRRERPMVAPMDKQF